MKNEICCESEPWRYSHGTGAPEYMQRFDMAPIQTITNRELALVMGRLTSEDAVKIHPKFPVQPGVSVRAVCD
jgi:hypothetical protein